MAIGIKSLSRLQVLQLLRGKSKSWLYGNIIAIAYIWIIEFVAFFLLKSEEMDTDIPTLIAIFILLGVIAIDFIFKLIFEHDTTVMDPFLKTRPVPQGIWDRFLSVSQLWRGSNLIMPLCLAPGCFLFMPFLSGLIFFVLYYCFSVFSGFMVMIIKHRGPYQSEKLVKTHFSKAVKSAKGNFISGIQYRGFLRSKRLKTSFVWLGVMFYFQSIAQSLNPSGNFGVYFIFLFIFCFANMVPQYGFAIEANFFNGIWSRPVNVEKLMTGKYWFGLLCGSAAALLCLPLCIWGKVSILDIAAILLFCCFAILIMMVDAYNCVPFDLFSKAYYNNQGRQSNFKASTFVTVLVTMGIGCASLMLLPGWKSQVILSGFGIIGLCIYRPFFRFVIGNFMKNRYKYMTKYTSR